MVKDPKKLNKSNSNTINSVLTNNNAPPKSRQQIYQENYQKNKEHKKQQRRARYQQDKEIEKKKQKERYEQEKEKKQAQQKINYAKKKEREQLSTKQQSAKYYGAEAIKVLLSLKEYTELNQQKHKLYADFCWTLQDCQKGINDIVFIMKLEQVASSLIRNYWETAKNETKKGKSWNSLSEEQQTKLIKYWGYEKARIENGYLDTAEQLARQSQAYLKDIELAKFHEERGKIKCDCYSCAEQKKIQGEIKQEIKAQNKEIRAKTECSDCGKLRVLDEEAGVCKSCKKKYE